MPDEPTSDEEVRRRTDRYRFLLNKKFNSPDGLTPEEQEEFDRLAEKLDEDNKRFEEERRRERPPNQ